MEWVEPKRLFVYDWQGSDAYQSFAPFAQTPYSIFLDSNKPEHSLSRYSFICVDPFETIEGHGDKTVISSGNKRYSTKADPFSIVRDRLALHADNHDAGNAPPVPFTGGAAGFFGYETGLRLEGISPRHNEGVPDFCIGIYDKVIAFDHISQKSWLFIHARNEQDADAKRKLISDARLFSQNTYSPQPVTWSPARDDEQFLRDIEKVIEYIYAGDIFQANLSRSFTAKLPSMFSPYGHYAVLRAINPAPYSAYLNFENVAIASSSPERFIAVKDRIANTRPIKGTLRADLPHDLLFNSEKDRAENAMIVDLLRNDFSKSCQDHSVEVEDLFRIESFAGLHHMVSAVKGILRADQTSLDLLKACYPGGSITGAPKIRAMQIIDELEPGPRGPYCGSIGYIGFDGAMDTSITIRTLIYHGDEVRIQTGAGITAASEPQKELEETLSKAEKIFESFTTGSEAKLRKNG